MADDNSSKYKAVGGYSVDIDAEGKDSIYTGDNNVEANDIDNIDNQVLSEINSFKAT